MKVHVFCFWLFFLNLSKNILSVFLHHVLLPPHFQSITLVQNIKYIAFLNLAVGFFA